MWNAEKSVENVTEWRHTLQVVQYDDGRRRTASDVIGDVISWAALALVGQIVEILAQLATWLAVDFIDWDELGRRTALHVVRPVTIPPAKPISELPSITCHIGSHLLPDTSERMSRLKSSQITDLPTLRECKAELTLVAGYTPKWFNRHPFK